METMNLGPGLGGRGLKLIRKEALVHELVYMRGYGLGLQYNDRERENFYRGW